jgi:hypothetical protein
MRWRRVAHRLPLTGVAVAGAVVGHMVAYVLAGPEPTVRVACWARPAMPPGPRPSRPPRCSAWPRWRPPCAGRLAPIPTAPGSYGFTFTGTIKGQKIDQTFRSGPDSFSDIEDPAQVQYPVKQPTGGQLATRADRETARDGESVAARPR